MSGMDRLTELLPCPFCGGEADTMTPEADDMRAATVMCMGCYCTGKECETEAQAIAAWNRRASQAAPAPSDGLREALVEIINLPPFYTVPVAQKLAGAALDKFRALNPAPAQEGDRHVKSACPICKGHSRFDQCSCHYEVKP